MSASTGWAGPNPGVLTISSTEDDGAICISLAGELDLSGARQLEECLQDAEAKGPARLVVDLEHLAFIDSTGLRLLLQADARARERGCELVLRPGEPSVQRVFEVTGALDVLRFEGASERFEGAPED
jgi:anti-sigma B factor antagonist